MKILIAVFLVFFIGGKIQATEYYLNSVSGNDQNNGTSENTPWKSLAPLQQLTLQPGDIVNFACNSSWTKSNYVDNTNPPMWVIDDSGTADKPIIFKSYGIGNKPAFSYTFDKWRYPIRITADYVIIDGLQVTQGYTGFDIATGADHNIIKNCEIKNCGMGFIVKGQYNLFTKNYIHDLVMVVNDYDPAGKAGPKGDNDYGCVSFWFYAGNNEVSYNTSIDNIQPSFDYQFDGGFIEVYTNGDNIYVHHNWVENGMGVIEASLGKGDNIKFAYNVFIEHKGLSAVHFNNFTLANFKFENNLYINKNGTLWDNLLGGVSNEMAFRNNIFVCGGDASERVLKSGSCVHSNNLFYLLDGAQLGILTLGTGEKVADPMFVDMAKKDYRLQSGSPAINSGANLGYTFDYNNNAVPHGTAPDIGVFEYSGTTSIGLNQSFDSGNDDLLKVFPNPSSGKLQLAFQAKSGEKYEVKVVDLQGKIVFAERNIAAINGLNKLMLNLATRPGMYAVFLLKEAEMMSGKLIVE